MDQRLRILTGPNQGSSFDLTNPGVKNVGKHLYSNDIIVADPSMARIHCQVEVDDKLQVTLEDMDTDTGTFVNGRRVQRQVLRHGDVIVMGATQFCFQSIEGNAPDAAPPTPLPAETVAAPRPLDDTAKSPPPRPSSAAELAVDSLGKLTGTTLGHFSLGPLLGNGHCGVVYRARDLKADRDVALKLFPPEFPKTDEENQRFTESVRKMLPLRHPNLVTLFGAGKTDRYTWLAMEHVEGENLAQLIDRAKRASQRTWQPAFRALVHLTRALHFAHKYRLLHRNLTPANVLFRSTDHLFKVNDVVLAHALSGSQLRQVALRGKVENELPFLPPEQTQAAPAFDVRSDLYGVGVLVYSLLAGGPPFVGANKAETITLIRRDDPNAPRLFQSDLPEAVEDVILKLLAKKPEDRHQTAAEVLVELAKVAPDI